MTKPKDRYQRGLKKRYQGHHVNRLPGNPLERKLADAWQETNTELDLIDQLLYVQGTSPFLGPVDPVSNQRAKDVSTVIQWLGSPVGFEWLVDTIGLEIQRELLARHNDQTQVPAPGQTYQSQDPRDKGRRVVVEGLRYSLSHRCYRRGPNTHWTVRNSETGRRSYIYERILLDTKKWKQVP
jgi:hypothetical protein